MKGLNKKNTKYESLARIKPPFCWLNHTPFVKYLIEEIKPGLVVELGTHSGNSLISILEACQSNNLNTKVYAIDTWLGDNHSKNYSDLIYHDLFSYVKLNYADNCTLLKMTFEEAVASFSDNSIDLLHIDGYHTYDAVKKDFEDYLPKMKTNGIVLFHDILVKDSDFGVHIFWEELSNKYPSFIQDNGTGLGVLLVSESSNDIFDSIRFETDKIKTFSLMGDVLRYKEEINDLNLELKFYQKSRIIKFVKKIRGVFRK
ncbi:class I SAM-dependent methyltransferase [Algoriphagus marinus]|uniref:class I SAM-dependent methyltransferase n=1 Tax=Algoriphagus marinus TaxID=1925762 RepID=UPI00094BBDCA|nr:class I SAM-dependent methyltransferase [Algoriphagus marinus]